mgnify:CR=1 FL=1
MTKDTENVQFQIREAVDEDWPWIIQGEVEIAWVRLSPQEREQRERESIADSVAQRIQRLRRDPGFPIQAFVACTEDGDLVGFVWLARTHNDSTGLLEASLMNQYVAEPYRGHGLGHCLMETAEDWARGQGLPRISLSVGVRNTLGQNLYKSLGYKPERVRMGKRLFPRQIDVPSQDND